MVCIQEYRYSSHTRHQAISRATVPLSTGWLSFTPTRLLVLHNNRTFIYFIFNLALVES